MIKFLKNLPIALVNKTLVLSELHLGFEKEFHKNGIVIPSQTEKFAKIIKKACLETGAEKLVIVGDVKHKVPGISLKEFKEIPKFFNFLKKFVEIIVVKGNHDAEIEKILDVKIFGSRGLKIGKLGFFHGHAKPSKELMSCDYLFAAHLHPCIQISRILRIWIKAKIKKEKVRKDYRIKKTGKLNLIILPAFNPFLGGTILNKEKPNLFGLVDFNDAEIYLLNGTFLGKMKDLNFS